MIPLRLTRARHVASFTKAGANDMSRLALPQRIASLAGRIVLFDDDTVRRLEESVLALQRRADEADGVAAECMHCVRRAYIGVAGRPAGVDAVGRVRATAGRGTYIEAAYERWLVYCLLYAAGRVRSCTHRPGGRVARRIKLRARLCGARSPAVQSMPKKKRKCERNLRWTGFCARC